MKKLMIAAAIVCAAVISQAAALQWQTWGWSGDSDPDSGTWFDGGQAYLVMITDAAKFAVADDLTVTGGSIVDSMAFTEGSAYGSWNDTGSLVDGQTYQFAMILTDSGTGITVPTTGLYGIDDNEGALYSVTWNAATGGGLEPTHEGIYVSTAVVPEPTSGLLLLLGMAGLALRRKQA
jgi:hypothetical protein